MHRPAAVAPRTSHPPAESRSGWYLALGTAVVVLVAVLTAVDWTFGAAATVLGIGFVAGLITGSRWSLLAGFVWLPVAFAAPDDEVGLAGSIVLALVFGALPAAAAAILGIAARGRIDAARRARGAAGTP